MPVDQFTPVPNELASQAQESDLKIAKPRRQKRERGSPLYKPMKPKTTIATRLPQYDEPQQFFKDEIVNQKVDKASEHVSEKQEHTQPVEEVSPIELTTMKTNVQVIDDFDEFEPMEILKEENEDNGSFPEEN